VQNTSVMAGGKPAGTLLGLFDPEDGGDMADFQRTTLRYIPVDSTLHIFNYRNDVKYD
jgi:hypothetical protein